MSHRLSPHSRVEACGTRHIKIALVGVSVLLLFFIWKRDSLVDRLVGQPRGNAALFCLSDRDCESSIQRALDQGADINARNDLGLTPLLLAVNAGQIRAVQALLDRGANPELGSPDGLTPLHFAILQDRPQVLQLLIDAGADRHHLYESETPIAMAARFHSQRAAAILQAAN